MSVKVISVIVMPIIVLMTCSVSFALQEMSANGKVAIAVRTDHPPKIDGRLDDPVWRTAPPATGFTQREGQDGHPASQRTEVRFLYDAEALYVGFMAYDAHPDSIVGRLTRRDQGSESDWLAVQLDTHLDGRTAYGFEINPAGVQVDRYTYDDVHSTTSRDAVWESATAITDSGWSAELKIPYTALRFPKRDAYVWGLYLGRRISRRQETSLWSYFPKSESGWVSRYGRLVGIEGIRPPKNVELLPYLASTTSVVSSGGREGEWGRAGLDLTYGVSPNLTLNATVNPDFGQVEADQTVLNLTTFETYYPEKRPFFVEGAQFFETPMMLFYSRRIGRVPAVSPRIPEGGSLLKAPQATTIVGAVKVSGKTRQGTTVGLIEAVTQREEATVVDALGRRQRQMVQPLTNYLVLRLRQDILQNSTVGVLVTGVQNRDGETAYTGGVDWNLRVLGNRYSVIGQLAGSAVHGERGGGGTIRLDREAGAHLLGGVRYEIQTSHLNLNDAGFLTRPDHHGGTAWAQYRSINRSGRIRDVWNSANIWFDQNLKGQDLGKRINVNPSLRFHNYWSLYGSLSYAFEKLDDRETRGGPAVRIPGQVNWLGGLQTDPRRSVQLGVQYQGGDERDGIYQSYELGVTLQPRSTMEVSVVPAFSRTDQVSRWVTYRTDTASSRVDVFGDLATKQFDVTVQGAITFSPRLSFQCYGQPFIATGRYRHFKRLISPDRFGELGGVTYTGNPDFTRTFVNANAVLRWEYRPGSTVFLVWTHRGERFQNRARFSLDGMFDQEDTENVFLVKVNYWWNR